MLSEAFISFTHIRYLKYVLFAIPSSIYSVVCSAFCCYCTMSPAVTSGSAVHPCPAITPPFSAVPPCPTFLTHLLICLPLYTMAHFHSLPLTDCVVCFFFCPSSPAFAVPAWKLLAALCTFCSIMHLPRKWLSVLSAVKLQNGFAATVPGAHLFTTNKSRPSPVVRRRNRTSLESAWFPRNIVSSSYLSLHFLMPGCHTKLNELTFLPRG